MHEKHVDSKTTLHAKREVDIVRMVSHLHVVSTYDMFGTSDGTQIVMEHINGGNSESSLPSELKKNWINKKYVLRLPGNSCKP